MHSGAAAASMMMNDDDFDVICFYDIHFDTCFIFQISYQLELSHQKARFSSFLYFQLPIFSAQKYEGRLQNLVRSMVHVFPMRYNFCSPFHASCYHYHYFIIKKTSLLSHQIFLYILFFIL